MRITRAFVALAALASPLAAQHPLPVNDNDWAESNHYVFRLDEVTEIYVTMAESDLDALIADTETDIYKVCSVRFVNSVVDETVDNVGIRPRGNSQRDSKKFPWKLSFDEFVSGRKFYGLEKMNLAGEATDPSLSRESMAYTLFRSVGVAAGRTSHVWLTINDGSKVQGVYNNIEQVDEEFVQAWFGNKDGELYKCRWKDKGAKLRFVAPGDAATYEALEDYEEKITGSYQRLADFVDFVTNASDQDFNANISSWINVDSFLRAQSIDMLLGQWDGLWIFPNNYYLYWDTEASRFEYIPWDLDHSMGMDYWIIPFFFGTNWARKPYQNWGKGSIASEPGNGNGPPLIDRLLKIPAYDMQLQKYAREFAANQMHPSVLGETALRLRTLIEPLVFTGSFSGPTMDNGYRRQDFLDSWESPDNYQALTNPATWGVMPYLRTRSEYVRDNYPDPQHLPAIVVNELMADNDNGIVDEAGENEDWVELYNNSDQAIDVSGFYLTDRYGNPRQWQIPAGTVIAARDYLLIWCDDDGAQGPLHANFKLGKDGEGVYLFANDPALNILVASLVYPAVGADEAYGRLPDGGRTAGSLAVETPLGPNSAAEFSLLSEGFVPDEVVLHAVGASPGSAVAFVYSPNPGSFSITGPVCPGVGLDMGAPVTLGLVQNADATGVATVIVPINGIPAGLNVQCLDVASCQPSNSIQL